MEAGVGGGYDDNPLRVQNGVDAPAAGFTHLHLVTDYDYERRRIEWSPRFHGDADVYGSSLERANTWEVNLDLPLVWVPYQHRLRKVEIAFAPFYEQSRKTFTRRASSEEFFDVGDQVSLAERFNSRAYGALTRLRYLWKGWSHADLEVEVRRRDYQKDFEEFVLIDSLDYDSLAIAPSFSYGFTKRFSGGVEGKYRRKDFDEKIPFDRDGNPALILVGTQIIPADAQVYRYRGAGGWLRYGSRVHRLKIRYRMTRRHDEFQGYLDRTEGEWSLDWDVEVSKRLALAFDLNYARVRYPHAHVFFDPALPLRLDKDVHGSAQAQIKLVPGWALLAYLSRDDAESRTSIFNYDRNRFGASVQYRFEGAAARHP